MTRESIVRLAAATVGVLAIGTLGCQTTQESAGGTAPTPTDSEWTEAPTPPTTEAPRVPLTDLQTVYFDYDRADIRPDAREALRANAELVSAASGTVTVEGHCDERGSTEYNLALGERRANAVKRYLVDLGVASSKLRTVSFGEDRPAVTGHDESAWRYNRRADFVGN